MRTFKRYCLSNWKGFFKPIRWISFVVMYLIPRFNILFMVHIRLDTILDVSLQFNTHCKSSNGNFPLLLGQVLYQPTDALLCKRADFSHRIEQTYLNCICTKLLKFEYTQRKIAAWFETCIWNSQTWEYHRMAICPAHLLSKPWAHGIAGTLCSRGPGRLQSRHMFPGSHWVHRRRSG